MDSFPGIMDKKTIQLWNVFPKSRYPAIFSLHELRKNGDCDHLSSHSPTAIWISQLPFAEPACIISSSLGLVLDIFLQLHPASHVWQSIMSVCAGCTKKPSALISPSILPLLFRTAKNQLWPCCLDQQDSQYYIHLPINTFHCGYFRLGKAEISDKLRHVVFQWLHKKVWLNDGYSLILQSG